MTKEGRSAARPRICCRVSTGPGVDYKQETYAGREVEAQGNCTRDTTLASPVGTKNHVEIWARTKFHPIIGYKITQLDTDYRSWDVSWSEVAYFRIHADGEQQIVLTRLHHEEGS